MNAPMDDEGNVLLAGILASTVGAGFVMYGKRAQRFPHAIAGIVLVVYPYFVSNLLLVIGIFLAVTASLWVAVRQGL